MPDNNLNGMLEDFVAFLVPEENPLLHLANVWLSSLEKQELNQYALIHRAKATIHTWLACQKDPGTPMGLAITKEYLSAEKENCQQLLSWVEQLFVSS
jgi:hypothetical protein